MRLIIFGTGQFAEIAHQYFDKDRDSGYEVVAFTAEKEYCKTNNINGIPLIPFEEIQDKYPASYYHMFVALVYGELNRVRERMVNVAKEKGYRLATYLSPGAFVWCNAQVGKNCFIFEHNTIQPFVEIKDNVILWSGNHVGHSSIIRENCFISSHAVISGNCDIGKNCFIGVNATIGDGVKIGEYSWVSPGAIITRNVPPNSLVKSIKSEVVLLNEEALFRSLG